MIKKIAYVLIVGFVLAAVAVPASSETPPGVAPVVSIGRFPDVGDGGLPAELVIVRSEQSVSDDGRLIGFVSRRGDYVDGDTNNDVGAFVWDAHLRSSRRATTDSLGNQVSGNPGGVDVVVSGSGRFAVVASASNELVDGDTNGLADVFLKDLGTGAVERVSVRSDGTEAVDGDIGSYRPLISADDRYVVFQSDATDLVDGDVNDRVDVFVHDRVTGETTRVTRDSDGERSAQIGLLGLSSDGRTALLRTGPEAAGVRTGTAIVVRSLDGALDVVVNRVGTALVLLEGLALSGDGSTVSYTRYGTVYVFDVGLGWRTIITRNVVDGSAVYGGSDRGTSISHDGRLVVFSSRSPDLVVGDTNDTIDVFLYDRAYGVTTGISVNTDGEQADGGSTDPVISGDGSTVIYRSSAANLIDGATLPGSDRFVVKLAAACQGFPATIVGAGTIDGTPGNDIIAGSDQPDIITAGGGDDLICGGAGDDLIRGGPGDDRLDGGPGNDDLAGGDDNDTLFDGPGSDTFRGGPGIDHANFTNSPTGVFVKLDDVANDGTPTDDDNVTTSIEAVTGSNHRDILVAGPLAAHLNGGPGNDTLRGGPGDDTINGDSGHDALNGLDGDDTLNGGFGDDVARGGPGQDTLNGGFGRNRLIGGPGNDVLNGGPEIDFCRGSAGFDTYFGCETAQP